MTDPVRSIVLVGGGLASAKAAETLRQRGYDGRLTLVGDEPEPPYERPPLSKAILAGDASAESAYVHPASFYGDHDVELITGDAVTDIDRAAGTVTTAAGRSLTFDRLLLATGARPRELPLGDRDMDGVLTLRTIADARALHERLGAAGHVTIVGAGWIGCEVAAAARGRGAAVTMVDPLDTPLQRVLGTEVGRVFAELHRDHGVDLRLGTGISGVQGGDRVTGVTLADGTSLDTELVVVGIGVVPRTELADRAGLDVDDGIVVDEHLVTSDARILAAGDVANAAHPRYGGRVRVEHWANALNQGSTAGANLLDAGEVYDRLPYFYSDQYDLGMEYVGLAPTWDRVILRGDPDEREFVAFWLAADRVVAAMNVNVWDVVEELKAVVAAGHPVDVDRLADPDTPLGSLVREPA